MPSFFLALAAETFEQEVGPALTACRRARSFLPMHSLGARLLPAASAAGLAETGQLLEAILAGADYDRHLWRAVAGDVLLLSAVEVPEIRLAPRSLCRLLGSGAGEGPRESFTPIEQALFGARELTFGPFAYRPFDVGLNDRADVRRLADYLVQIDPSTWQPANLAGVGELDAEEWEEEVEFVKEGVNELTSFYQRSAAADRWIVCE